MNTPQLETDRLILRKFKESDMEALYLLLRDETVNIFLRNPRSGGAMKQMGMKYQYSYEEQWQPKNLLVTFRMYQLNFDENNFVFKKYWDNSAIHFIEKDV